MPKTHIAIQNESFLIDGKLTYTDILDSPSHVQGLLMNARFIQGVFDDKADPTRFARFGRERFDRLTACLVCAWIAGIYSWFSRGRPLLYDTKSYD